MESKKEEFQKEWDALKYDIHSIKEEILNEIRVWHTPKSFNQEEVNENKDGESQSVTGKVEAQLKIKKFESLTYDLSSAQDPHFQEFNSMPWNYFISNIDMIKFDGNYHVEWMFQMEQFFETMMKQLRNQAIMEYRIKWKNLPIEDLTWEDSFIQKCQQLIKHWGQCLSEGEVFSFESCLISCVWELMWCIRRFPPWSGLFIWISFF